ncbi:hypothetical protein MLD38_009291 [Melastoma candidum]|uniref:Uncharacterized protein n=1 Tax=Melastoma candidum TaxID=119954 RepID=A0ACB9RWS7_9MYRT|nr:hypothetical protein MLD38_009291 [Melastoma candidum]
MCPQGPWGKETSKSCKFTNEEFQSAESHQLRSSSQPKRGRSAMLSPPSGSRTTPELSKYSESYYYTFHTMPEKRCFSEDEWRKFTKDFTKRSMEDLVSSPNFGKWAVAHADTLDPPVNDEVGTSFAGRLRKWVTWSQLGHLLGLGK